MWWRCEELKVGWLVRWILNVSKWDSSALGHSIYWNTSNSGAEAHYHLHLLLTPLGSSCPTTWALSNSSSALANIHRLDDLQNTRIRLAQLPSQKQKQHLAYLEFHSHNTPFRHVTQRGNPYTSIPYTHDLDSSGFFFTSTSPTPDTYPCTLLHPLYLFR